MTELTEEQFNECEQAERIKHDEKVKELEAENEQIKNSDTLCKLIGEQKIKITELKAQIEKMKQELDTAREEANRQEQWELYSVLNGIYNDNFEVTTSVSN